MFKSFRCALIGFARLPLALLLHERDSISAVLISNTPTRIGSPLQVISTSVSLCTVTPSLVKIEIVPSSAVLPTLIKDVGKSLKESACAALLDSRWIGSLVTYAALLVLPLATPILVCWTCAISGVLLWLDHSR